MKLISHRGNLNGSNNPERENSPAYIREAIRAGFDVEVDLWVIEKDGVAKAYLGHDKPQYEMPTDFSEILDRLYFHCKNLDAIQLCHVLNMGDVFGSGINYFSHDRDPFVLTSKGDVWTFPDPNRQLCCLSIPVVYNRDNMLWSFEKLQQCFAICTDDVLYFDGLFNGSAH